MRRLGISVYPNHKPINEIVDYIHLAGKYGFREFSLVFYQQRINLLKK